MFEKNIKIKILTLIDMQSTLPLFRLHPMKNNENVGVLVENSKSLLYQSISKSERKNLICSICYNELMHIEGISILLICRQFVSLSSTLLSHLSGEQYLALLKLL